ncbi:lysine N(6)-hydroxylase/L-ornithine N(5)-oxygenase family protein [Streptomyces erythrochromogenes]|uniref:lysine N(6)-hydroxylase/L-ornithine N(5)-oxygenase family protein n=1 Tax=Streptomyces erythrochromogenes TaxID=285574 RepID=UPI0036FD29C4
MSAPHTHTGSGERFPVVRDLVGIGFGPANLALAIAVAEHNARRSADEAVLAAFVERQEAFCWHPGMLLDGATMQVSFLKDLVTLRNPASPYSFLQYLQEHGRLPDFINQKTFFPTRVEFHDYFRWCAEDFAAQVSYGTEATRVAAAHDLPGTDPDALEVLQVHHRPAGAGPADAGEAPLYAHNLVLGTGLLPRLPQGVSRGEHIWHTSELLHRTRSLTGLTHRRFVVVGAGQSAAEAAEHLHRTFPEAEVCAVFARYGYSPADDSPFANRIFDPAAVDDFYAAPDEVKDKLLGYHANTNYSVVDGDLITQLYRTVYQEKVSGTERLRILNTSEVADVREEAGGARATVRSLIDGTAAELHCDAVVYATGYAAPDPRTILGDLVDDCLTDGRGRLRIGRDHRVVTTPRLRAGIYLQGAGTEHTHGLTSSLLSTLAVRSGEICDSLLLSGAERAVRTGRDRLAAAAAGAGAAPHPSGIRS